MFGRLADTRISKGPYNAPTLNRTLPCSAARPDRRAPPAKPKTPSEIVAAAPGRGWRDDPGRGPAGDDARRRRAGRDPAGARPSRRSMSPISASSPTAGYWQGAAVYRVQDNYVAQWGNNESEARSGRRGRQAAGRICPRPRGPRASRRSARPTPMRRSVGFARGWPVALYTRRHRQPDPLLRHGRGRPRPVSPTPAPAASSTRHRPRPAPPRPQHRRGRAGRSRGSSI